MLTSTSDAVTTVDISRGLVGGGEVSAADFHLDSHKIHLSQKPESRSHGLITTPGVCLGVCSGERHRRSTGKMAKTD